ncbi:SCO2583 family membrane protein [Streptomyces sp. SS8]
MTGPGEPPPRGFSGGGDDEYRSTVFDESFVRAARLQEFSARERLADREHPVRPLPPRPLRGRPWRGLVLAVLIVFAFGAVVYAGIRTQQQQQSVSRPGPRVISSTVVPLSPGGESRVPGGRPARLLERSPAAEFYTGAAGVTLPPVRSTAHFADSQVLAALAVAKEYVVESSLNPEVLSGETARPVRILIDPDQHAQFDRSIKRPAADGHHAATGWLVRFAPGHTEFAGEGVRVRGTMEVRESEADALEIVTDHVFVYTVRPAGASGERAAGDRPDGEAASLFTVRRELRLRFDREDLRDQHLTVERSEVRAGPMSCAAPAHDALRPLTAGQSAGADHPAGTDPYVRDGGDSPVCGTLDPSSLPRP